MRLPGYVQSKIPSVQQVVKLDFLLVCLSTGVLFTLALANYYTYLHWDFDDSYIVYRISRNILRGHGWVYNVGEAHNASTSVLNVVLIAALAYVIEDIRLAAHVAGGMAIWGAGITTYWLFRQRFDNNTALLAGYVLIQGLSRNRSWGLETNLLICLVLLFVLLETCRKDTWILLGAIVLTRPDGILLVGLKWLNVFVSQRSHSLKGITMVLFILAPWAVYSLYQFGTIFPDTLSQKLWQGHSGLWGTGDVYLKGLTDHYLIASDPLLKASLLGAVIGSILMLRHRCCWLYFITFALLQQIVYIGLNVPPYHWYFALSDASVYIAALYAVGQLLSASRRYFSGTGRYSNPSCSLTSFTQLLSPLFPIVLLLIGWFTVRSDSQYLQPDPRYQPYVSAIQEIDTRFGQGKLATVEVGFIGFHTDRTVVDITGLTSTSGQFATMDRMDVFYGNPPELLLLHDPVWGYEAAIYNDYRFPFTYEKEAIFPEEGSDLQLFVRKEGHENIDVQKLSERYSAFQAENHLNPDKMLLMPPGSVHLDHVNGYNTEQHLLIVNKRALLQIQGWAVDLERQQTPATIFVLLRHENGPTYSLPAARIERLDVARTLNNSAYVKSGFKAEGLTVSMPPGTYHIYVVQEAEGTFYSVKLETKVVIPGE